MNMAGVPRTRCPYCLHVLQPWHRHRTLGICSACRRPLALLPAIANPRAYRLWNVMNVLYIVTLPIIGGALISTAIGDLPPRELVTVVAIMLLLWGSADLWDGYAGIRTQIVRSRKIVHQGTAARRRFIPKAIAGATSLVLGVVGLAL